MKSYQEASGRAWQRKIIPLFLLAGFPWANAWADAPPVPDAMQVKINKAIDDGVNYLKSTAGPWGTWAADKNHVVGYAAMPGLTLLECGVSPQSPLVQNAAILVRLSVPRLDTTYEISLSILFLDRLGDVKDRPVIQKLALRLIAGQTPTGGWTYRCPILSDADHKELLAVLRNLDNPVLFDPTAGLKSALPNNNVGIAGTAMAVPREDPLSGTSLGRSVDAGAAVSQFSPSGSRHWAWCIKSDDPGAMDATSAKKRAKVFVPPRLRGLPVLFPPAGPAEDLMIKPNEPIWGTSDNSNTHFAIVALWAARHHQVPTARTLNLIARRFYTSQNPDGTWGYHHRVGGDPDVRAPMTCIGLIGLAVAHGLAHDLDAKVLQGQDVWVVNGLLALTKNIGVPAGRTENLPMANLYFLWTVERVGVLYNLPTIGNKDWYRWGAEVLVANQKKPGNWEGGQYYGSTPTIDTCMALLFLKRANLLGDLAKLLPFKPADLARDVAKMLPGDPHAKESTVKTVAKQEDVSATTSPGDASAEQKAITPVARVRTEVEPAQETSSRTGAWLLGILVLVIGGGVGLALLARNSEEEDRPKSTRRAKRKAAH
ncbi:MAG TPA: hypothetical protein VNX28_05045 [Gemmataceae bacterium]|nr:hypothetical protein [Gemmataceae bacterium]